MSQHTSSGYSDADFETTIARARQTQRLVWMLLALWIIAALAVTLYFYSGARTVNASKEMADRFDKESAQLGNSIGSLNQTLTDVSSRTEQIARYVDRAVSAIEVGSATSDDPGSDWHNLPGQTGWKFRKVHIAFEHGRFLSAPTVTASLLEVSGTESTKNLQFLVYADGPFTTDGGDILFGRGENFSGQLRASWVAYSIGNPATTRPIVQKTDTEGHTDSSRK